MTGLRICSYFLGISIILKRDGIFLSQQAYTERLITTSGMSECKPAKYPLPLHIPLNGKRVTLSEDQISQMHDKPYSSIVGGLIYLATRTRPNISTATSMLGKFQNESELSQWKMLQHLVRYLKDTADYGTFLLSGKSNEINFYAWIDSDWAHDEQHKRSCSGFVLTVNRGPITWSSKLQTDTVQSSTAA